MSTYPVPEDFDEEPNSPEDFDEEPDSTEEPAFPDHTLEPLDPFGDHGSGIQKESESSNELSSESLETPDNSDELFG